MSNPVSSIPSAQLPAITAQAVDPKSGLMTQLFYRFITGLWQRTGGAAGVNANDVTQVATQALSTAQTANQTASKAQAQVNVALSQIAALDREVQSLEATSATTVQTVQGGAALYLQRLRNLGDVGSPAAARVNLGVALVPVTFQWDSLPGGLKRGYPLVQAVTVPANLAGTQVWWDVNPTSDAVFTLASKNVGVLGTITIVHGGSGIILSQQPATSLAIGDVLYLTTPGSSDATLARVAITLALTL